MEFWSDSKTIKVKNLVIILLLCLLCSCVSTTVPDKLKDSQIKILFTRKPPEFNKFKKIYNKPYKMHQYDCSNKCAEYVSHLMGKGIFCQLLVIDHDGPDIDKRITYEKRPIVLVHAIVRVFWKNKFIYCDPTNFTWSNHIKDFSPEGLGGIINTVDLNDFRSNYKEYSF
jgi:hypothetical protein